MLITKSIGTIVRVNVGRLEGTAYGKKKEIIKTR